MTPALDVQLRSALARFELPREPSLERVARGASHHTFRVQAGSLRAYLRVYATPDAKRAHREHALIRRVRSTGTLAPAPIEDRTGKTVVEHQGLVLALYEAMPGAQHEPATIGLSEAASAGRTLAELHQQTAALPDDGYLRWALDWDGDAWVKRLERIETAIVERGTSSSSDEWALRRTREQKLWLADRSCPHRHQPAFAPQLTHGDYQHANLLFDRGQVSGIIDWDQAALMPRAYEALRACSFTFLMDPLRSRTFLDAYARVSGASPDELDDGARAWGCFHDHHVWPLEQLYLAGNEAARRFIPHEPFRPFELRWRAVRQ